MIRADDPPPVLLTVANLLQSEINIDVLLRRVTDLIAAATKADRCTLFLVDRSRSEIYSKVAHLPEIREIRLLIGQGIAGHVAATGEALVTNDVHSDHRFLGQIDATTGYHTKSALTVPVFALGATRDGGDKNNDNEDDKSDSDSTQPRVIAVLQVLNKHDAETFDSVEMKLLQALAEQLSELLALIQLADGHAHGARYNKIVGSSAAMQPVYDRIASAASTDATVLVLGESGTGKERVARAIHVNGTRAAGPFIKVDCTAIPAGLIEAELFGHEKGAFTGADRRVLGKCELADKGTLFLDEIGEMPLPLQAKLLRFVQERELERVGGREVIKTDVRVVAATHRDLAAAVDRGEFRRDLFYRLKVVEIETPPLRERGPKEIELLARHFLRIYSRKHRREARRFAPSALTALATYRWPGNVRELEHCVESATVICRGEIVSPAHLSLRVDADAVAEWEEALSADSVPSGLSLDELEKRYILRTLAECNGNRTRAAGILGIGRNTLLRKLKRYGQVG